MSYVIKAVLSNAQHPEYGQFTIPFPIPQDAYDDMVEALKNMEIGDPILQDCHVDELESSYSILKRLEKTNLNLDELDYLAKRLDSFDMARALMPFPLISSTPCRAWISGTRPPPAYSAGSAASPAPSWSFLLCRLRVRKDVSGRHWL